jgi:FkbM family methyltransferase
LIRALLSEGTLTRARSLVARLRPDPRFRNATANPDARMLFAALRYLKESRAQLFQDVWVLDQTDFQRDGFFVEIGAFDGGYLSNTYLLETKFGWRGILVEPNPLHQAALAKRVRSQVSNRCVTARSGETVEFFVTKDPELSTIGAYAGSDSHAPRRLDHQTFQIETVSLLDLLDQHKAPKTIDYLSVDTEGSELDILGAFDFEKYDVRFLTVEHNHGPNKSKLRELMRSEGYRQVLEGWSRFEDWYVKAA